MPLPLAARGRLRSSPQRLAVRASHERGGRNLSACTLAEGRRPDLPLPELLVERVVGVRASGRQRIAEYRRRFFVRVEFRPQGLKGGSRLLEFSFQAGDSRFLPSKSAGSLANGIAEIVAGRRR